MSLVFVVAQGRASIIDVDVELPIVFLADAGGGAGRIDLYWAGQMKSEYNGLEKGWVGAMVGLMGKGVRRGGVDAEKRSWLVEGI